jgi:hypothetical protein
VYGGRPHARRRGRPPKFLAVVERRGECIGDHVVDDRPGRGAGASAHLVVDGHKCRIGSLGVTQAADEVKARRRNGQHGALLSVAAGEGVGHRVRGA